MRTRKKIKDCKFWKPRGKTTHYCTIDVNNPIKRCFGVCNNFKSIKEVNEKKIEL